MIYGLYHQGYATWHATFVDNNWFDTVHSESTFCEKDFDSNYEMIFWQAAMMLSVAWLIIHLHLPLDVMDTIAIYTLCNLYCAGSCM